MKLHLGVIDIPYQNAPNPKSKKVAADEVTTGDVAGWLENKYQVMEVFFYSNAKQISGWMLEAMEGSIEEIMLGNPTRNNPMAGVDSKIEDCFKAFLTNKGMDGIGGWPPIPTAASLKGISSRFKNKRGPVRPSFIDTGLYQSSFKAWFD